MSSASAEREGQGEVGGVTCRVLCTRQLLARLSCKGAMVGTGWAAFCLGCMSGLRKHYSHLVGGSFPPEKAVWVLNC